jgi:hypothetical protein
LGFQQKKQKRAMNALSQITLTYGIKSYWKPIFFALSKCSQKARYYANIFNLGSFLGINPI